MADDRVEINRQPLSEAVERARDRFEELLATVGPEIEPRLERRRRLHSQILHELRDAHAAFVDRTDFDPEADTRPGAAWMVGGRCLSQAGALLTLLTQRYGPEIVPAARSIHEASRLLSVLIDPGEPELLENWLADEWVRPRDMSQAEERHQTRLVEQMIRVGARPAERTHELTKDVYSHLSAPAHHRRSSFAGEFNHTLRRYAYGPLDSPLRRAFWQIQADEILYDAYLSVGVMLTTLYGPTFFAEVVEPGLRAIRELQSREPLLPDDLIRTAGAL